MSSILCLTPYAQRVLLFALVAVLSLLAVAPTAPSQCFGPDNLNGPCCAVVPPNLPPFPSMSLPAAGICWQGCLPGVINPLSVTWPTPAPTTCGSYQTPITVIDTGSGSPILTGMLILDYTRTWDEVDATGVGHQVWRFTAKVDLSSAAGSTALVCPKPPCLAPLGPHPTAFYYGYLDYAGCNAAGPWEASLVLYHAADRFIHMPGLSDRPGNFHPASAYAIVAPHSTVQPFVPGNFIPSLNPIIGEAVRRTGPTCLAEDKVQQAQYTLIGAGCVNTMAANPKQQTLRQSNGLTNCGVGGALGQWVSLNVNFPVFPWWHQVATSIGQWTSPLAYPGPEHAWVEEGFFVHREACSGFWVDMKYGASTEGGWTPFTQVGPVKAFTDLADNYSAPVGGPYPTPLLGSVRPTDRLIYVNQ